MNKEKGIWIFGETWEDNIKSKDWIKLIDWVNLKDKTKE